MEWRIGVSLFFLLILLISVLHLAYATIPPIRFREEPQGDMGGLPGMSPMSEMPLADVPPGPSAPLYGQMRYATITNERVIDADKWKRVAPPPTLQFDASGNLLYPY
jgi:hypothetical protein